ncbi:MAG: DUF378 domain-containing protein [Planctomycetes bacterium]|nr:DUF378 domain-containing protein [Planctomycetota bacterium]
MKSKLLKSIDVLVWSLLTIGAFNWGLVGFFNFNLVGFILGPMTLYSRIVYSLVGLAALYEIFGVRSIAHRWDLRFRSAHPA